MSTKSLGRIAALSAMTLVAGMLPAVMFAGTAAAAAPTVLSVTPSTQTVNGDNGPGFADYIVGFNNEVAPGGIYYAVASGPDGASATFSDAAACTPVPPGGTESTCSVSYNGAAGTDNLVFFYSPTTVAPVQFDPANAMITGTLIVTGTVNAITAAPTATHVAQGQWAEYTLTATDANGNAIPDQDIDIAGTGPDLQFVSADPLNAFTATTVTVPLQAATLPVTTDATGSVPFWANATGTGTFNFTLTPNPTVPGIQGVATLTVDPGTANDVTSVVIEPATQTAFQDAPVEQIVTVLNTQGDIVGDPAALPKASITAGPNIDQPVTVSPVAGEVAGTYLAEYTTLPPSVTETTTGTDTLQAFVDHTPGTAALDPGEPSDTATITVVGRPVGPITLNVIGDNPVTAFTNSTTVPVIVELDDGNGDPLSGYGVDVVVDDTNSAPPSQLAGYSVDPALAFTGTDGRFVATVTNANPLVGDVVTIDATLVGDISVNTSAQVDWTAPVDVVAIQPYVSTGTIGGTASFSATTVNPVGTPVNGVNYIWQIDTNSTTINGVGASFSYTDSVSPTADHQDTVTVTAYQSGVVLGSDTTTQYWVRDGSADQVNITLDDFSGGYTGQGINNTLPPFTPHGFVSTLTTAVIPDPTPTQPVVNAVPIGAMLADGNNNRLYGQVVTFTSSGVGTFVDENGAALQGNSITARVDDGLSSPTSEKGIPASDPNILNFASVFVRSSVDGVQTLTATVNGQSSTGIITWSGQYVPLTPFRVFDTRTGQGGVGTDPVPLNTLTYFDYRLTALPLAASAYVFNVTAIGPTDVGNLRIADGCEGDSLTRSSEVPDTSLVNYQVGKTIANAIVVPSISPYYCGLRVYSDNSPVDVAIDVEGYYVDENEDAFQDLPPTRIADTRTGVNTGGASEVAEGSTVGIQITGTNIVPGSPGIPDDAKAVAVNLTAINPDDLGNLRVFPDGAPVPNASNINYIPGVDKAAFAVIDLPANGKINVFSDGASIGLAVDVFGYYPAGSNVVTQAPVRVYDSRNSSPLEANVPRTFAVAGQAGVPVDAQAVLVSVTSIHNAASTGVGNLRIFPAGGAGVPNISNVNYISPTSDVANFAIVSLGGGGELTLYSDGTPIDAAVDVVGYVPAGS